MGYVTIINFLAKICCHEGKNFSVVDLSREEDIGGAAQGDAWHPLAWKSGPLI